MQLLPHQTGKYKLLAIVCFLCGFITCSLIFSSSADAERMESNSFVIQFGNLNMGSGEQDSATYNLTQTLGQIAPGPYSSASSFLGGGFQYIYSINYFRFTISKLFINFDELQANSHKTDSNVLTIDTKGAGGYTVYAYETRPLMHSNNVDIIPDTTCDTGTCSQSTAQIWTNQTIPGFGFNASGDTVPADFSTANHYRQFADRSAAEPMQIVMSSPNIAKTDQATITYKAGVTGTQPAGNYRTEVVYIAVPGY